MNTNLLTNTLLAIIAVLLLVQVIQTGMNQPSYSRPPMNPHMARGPAMNPENADGESQAEEMQPPMGNPGRPMQMPVQMVFHALKAFPKGCEGKNNLAECDSAEARSVKSQIEKVNSKGGGPRAIFDFIVNTWGEGALSDEAASIRRQRVKNH